MTNPITYRFDTLIDRRVSLRTRLIAAAQGAEFCYGEETEWGEYAARAGAGFAETITVSSAAEMLDAQVCVATTGQVCVVAYRGTPATSLRAWLRNLQARRSNYLGRRVHAGMLAEFAALQTRLQRVLDYCLGDRKLVLLGHSKGGGLSEIDAFTRITQKLDVPDIFTFGAPRVLNWDAAADIDTFVEYYAPCWSHYRVVHSNDCVPLVPGISNCWRYRHAGELVLVTEDGELLDKPTWWQRLQEAVRGYELDAIEDHFIGGYIDALESRE